MNKKFITKLIVLVVVLILLFAGLCESFGSFADWFSALGSLGALLMVLYQVDESKKQFRSERKDEREREFSIERPFFIMKVVPFRSGNNVLSPLNEEAERKSDYKMCIRIKNISDKPMLAVSCLVVKKVGENKWEEAEIFQIERIKKDDIIYLASKCSDVNEGNYKILVYYHTTIRERTRLVFDILKNNELQYDWANKQLENQGKEWAKEGKEFKKFNDDYDIHVNNFVESEKVI